MRMNSSHQGEISPQRTWDLTKVGRFLSMSKVFAGLFHLDKIAISWKSSNFHKKFGRVDVYLWFKIEIKTKNK